jgi:hypothetical protein
MAVQEMKKIRWAIGISAAGILGGLMWAAPAHASDAFGGARVPSDDRMPVSVDGLYKLNPQSIRPAMTLGGFLFQSSVAGTATYDDNIFATANNRKSDITYTLAPEVRATSTWTRNKLEFIVGGSGNFHQDHASENTSSFYTGMSSVVDVRHDLHILSQAKYAAGYEARGTGNSLFLYANPIQMETVDGAVSINKEFNRLWVQFGTAVRDTSYGSAKLNGVTIDQSFRDSLAYQVVGKAGYELSGKTSFFVEASENWNTYGDSSFDTSGYQLMGGVKYLFTTLVRGEAAGGFMQVNTDSTGRNSIDTYTYRAQLDWNPTELVTVGAVATRNLTGPRDTQNPAVKVVRSNAINSEAGVRVGYAWRPNVTLSGVASYGNIDYVDLNRNDDMWKFQTGASYQVNSNYSVSLTYGHTDYQASTGGFDYKDNRLTAGLTARY